MANSLENCVNYLAKNLITLREKRQMSQAQLSKISGVPRSTVTYLESGLGNPSLVNVVKVALALQVSVEELLSAPRHDVQLTRFKELPKIKKSQGMVTIYSLLPEEIPGIQIERMEIEVEGKMGGVPHLEGTKEYFTCMSGTIGILVGGVMNTLQAGDVLAFQGNVINSYQNLGSKKVVGISLLVMEK